MADLSDPFVVRDVILEGLCQLCSNTHLTPLMEQLLREMEFPPGVERPESWAPHVQAWALASRNVERTLKSLRMVNLEDHALDEANYEPILELTEDGKAEFVQLQMFTLGGGES